jgi:protein Tex
VVTNVTNFGAFVDVGVHQDGLVHVSELSDKWVDDPRKVVKVGDRLKVRVLTVDLERQRIALSAKREPGKGDASSDQRGAEPAQAPMRPQATRGGQPKPKPTRDEGFGHNPFAKLRR